MNKMQTKIIALVVLTLAIGFGMLVFFNYRNEKNNLVEASQDKADMVAASVSTSLTGIMLSGDPDYVSDMVDDLRRVDGIDQIRVFDNQSREVYASSGYGAPSDEMKGVVKKALGDGRSMELKTDKMILHVTPLNSRKACLDCHPADMKVLGAVAINISLGEVNEKLVHMKRMSLLNALVFITLIGIILFIWIRRVVLSPLRSSVDVITEIARTKDLTIRMKKGTDDEIGMLSESFNDFIEGFQRIIKRLNRMSYQVGSVSTQIVVNSDKVVDGAQVQARSAESTSSAIEEMNASIREVADSADSLSYSAEATSSSILELTASIDEIAGSAAVLSSSVASTASSITQISASIKEVSTSVGVLTEAAEKSVDFISQIAKSIKGVEEAAKESSELSERVSADARNLEAGAMGRTIDGMEKISDAVERSSDVIGRLDVRSRQIGEILTVIDEVTEQTELLSLNAAILASQAGEHGKGFAVVADEIKDLAERTDSSTQEISKLIASVQSEVKEAVRAMESGREAVTEGRQVVYEAREVLGSIVESSAESSNMTRLIANSTIEQANGARQVKESMVNVRDMVKQILKASQDLTSGSEQVMKETEKIKDVATQVRLATEEQSKGSDQIIKAVENVTEQMQHIASATSEQRKGSEDIVVSVERIREVTNENESLASDMSVAVEDLSRSVDELKDQVSTFRTESAGAETLKIGLVPLESPVQMFKRFTPLAEYLSEKLGREVVFKLTTTFADAVKDIGAAGTDICYMTPTTYIEAHDQYGVELVAKALRNGSPYSHTIIVTREDSGIKSLEELNGRSFAFGDKMSTSSWLVPMYMLSKAGVKLSDLSEYRFLGHHDDVAKAVLLGELDAGGLRETTAEQFRSKGLGFLAKSEDIPEFNFCVRPGMDDGVVDQIRAALVGLSSSDSDGARILRSIDKSYTGFMAAADSDYNMVRVMLSKVSGG